MIFIHRCQLTRPAGWQKYLDALASSVFCPNVDWLEAATQCSAGRRQQMTFELTHIISPWSARFYDNANFRLKSAARHLLHRYSSLPIGMSLPHLKRSDTSCQAMAFLSYPDVPRGWHQADDFSLDLRIPSSANMTITGANSNLVSTVAPT